MPLSGNNAFRHISLNGVCHDIVTPSYVHFVKSEIKIVFCDSHGSVLPWLSQFLYMCRRLLRRKCLFLFGSIRNLHTFAPSKVRNDVGKEK